MSAPAVSFEFFPPRDLEASFRLWDTVQVLAPLEPRFVSVTYGAGGTTRELTRDAVSTLHKSSGLKVAAHLTCVDASREETLGIAGEFAKAGVNDIVALRGDPPKGVDRFVPHAEGFADSCELIAALKDSGDFTIRVGAYPDKHPEAADDQADIDWLKRKLDAGADEALTQFFFEAETFLRFRDRCAAAGITAPIVPGILPIENWNGARRFAEEVLSVLVVALLVLSVIAIFFMPALVGTIVAPAFADTPEKFDLTVLMTRIMFPYLFCMSLVAMLSGILNSMRRYFLAAIVPVLLNVILSVVLVAALYAGVESRTTGVWLAWGVLASGIAQLLFLILGVGREGYSMGFRRPRMTPSVKRLLLLMGPAMLTGGVTQINLLVGQIIASAQDGAIALLNYADRINQLPLGVIGIAVGSIKVSRR